MEVVALEMKVLRRSLLAVAALLVATSNATPIDTVVLVVADDLGSSDPPVIDSLRNEGTFLTQYHVYRACSPTRAALLTPPLRRLPRL